MTHTCCFPLAHQEPKALTHHFDNLTLIVEHTEALFDLLTSQTRDDSIQVLADLDIHLCHELRRRANTLLEAGKTEQKE